MSKRKSPNTWKSLEFTLEQARQIMEAENWNKLPSDKILPRAGYVSLSKAITKYHGGFHHFRQLLGETSVRTQMGSWQDIEFTLEQARNFLRIHPEYETLPSPNILCQSGCSSLSKAIVCYHGGFPAFRETLKQYMTGKSTKEELEELSAKSKSSIPKKMTKPPNTWKSLEFTLEQARQIMEAENWNKLPQQKILLKKGYAALSVAIVCYHGGFHHFRQLLGETPPRTQMGSWQDLEFTIQQAQQFLKEHPEYQTLPSPDILAQLKYTSLTAAICKYHGGFPAFRETLHQHTTGKSSKQELEDLLESYAGDD